MQRVKIRQSGRRGDLLILLIILLVVLPTSQAQSPSTDWHKETDRVGGRVPAAGDIDIRRTQAISLLSAARQAAGDRQPLTLQVRGTSRRFVKYIAVKSPTRIEERQRELSGRFQLDFALPDRFRVWMKGDTLGGYGFKVEEVVNGSYAWRNPPLNVRSFNSDPRVIDIGDVERTLLMQARSARQQATFHALGLLAISPASYPLELREAGRFEFAGESYDRALAATPDGLLLNLLFDRQTRLLVGLATSYIDTFQEAVVAEVASVDRRFLSSTYARAREERRRRRHPRQLQEVVWRFTDHRPVAGLLIPHRSLVYFNGRLIEENTITQLRLDESIKARRFEGQGRVKY
jgi:hypothetical protein